MIPVVKISGKRLKSGFTEESREVIGEVPGDSNELQNILSDLLFERMKKDGLLDEAS